VRAVLRIIDSISESTGWISYGLILLALVVFVEVISRYAFGKPIIWAHETGVYLYGSIGALAGAYAFRHHMHIRMDIVYNHLSLRKRAVVDVVMGLFFFFYLIVLLLSTGKFAIWGILTNHHSSSPWGPPLYPIQIVMVIAAFLVLLQGSVQFIRDLYHALTGREIT